MKILSYEEMKKLEPCVEVEQEDLPEIKKIAEEMIKTCVSEGGIGLAAPQVGINAKMFIYSPDAKEFHIVINPFYTPAEKKKVNSVEQCLSLDKEKFYFIERNKFISTKYYSLSPNGEKLVEVKRRMRGDEAIVFQHEYDHLLGISLKDKGKEI